MLLGRLSADDYDPKFEAQGIYSEELEVPKEIFNDYPYELNPELLEIRNLVANAPARLFGQPIWIQEPDSILGFQLQFNESFIDMNLGDAGYMYVGYPTGFYQS